MESGTRNGFNPPDNKIYLGESIYNVGADAFKNYGNSSLTLVVPYEYEQDKGSPYNDGKGINYIIFDEKGKVEEENHIGISNIVPKGEQMQ